MTQKKTPTSVETLTPEEALAKRARERALAAKRESRQYFALWYEGWGDPGFGVRHCVWC